MLTSRKSAHGFALSLCLLVTRTALCSGGDSCPSTIGTEHQGFVHRSQCYQFVNRKEWWETARKFCARKGGHLIQLDNSELVAFIKGKLRGNYGDWDTVWIGANDRGTENKWIWDGSDEEISYSNWGQGQPSTSIFVGPFEDCATMEKADDYRWHDHACGIAGQAYQFICQYDAVNRTATTRTTTSSTITTETTTGTKTAKTTTTIRVPSSATVAPPAPGNRTAGNHSTLSALWPKTNTTTATTTVETPSASTPAVPPTRHGKTTGHHPTPSALLSKTTTATTKTSTIIRTSPSSSSTPVAPSIPDASRYTCPQNLEPNYQTFTYRDHCYQFVTKEEWRSTAQEYCRKYQGQLIEIPDQSTMDFVIDVLNKKLKWGVNGVWNGASDQREEGVWEWDGSGNPVIYSNWALGQPGGLTKWTDDCACMRRTDNWQWHDYGCSQPGYSYRYICQYDLVENISTSTVLSPTRSITSTPGSSSKKTGLLSTMLPKASLPAKSSLVPLPFNKTASLRTATATTATSAPTASSTRVALPTGDSNTTGHHPTLSALLTKTTTATTKTSTTIQTTPSSSSSSTPVALSTPDASRYTCPQNLEPNYQTFTYRDHCYQFVTKEEWRSTAQEYCRKYQGQLMEIPDQSTMDFLIDVLNEKLKWGVNGVWNGATDQREEGVWKWDGSDNPVIYSNWAQGQPGGLARWTEDCACMRRTNNWQWHDYGCSQLGYSYRYICQYDLVENITTSKVLSSTRSVTTTPVSSSQRTKQQSTVSSLLPETSLPAKSSSVPLPLNKTASFRTLAATTATSAPTASSTRVVLPTGDSNTTGHHPTLSALLTKTTKATRKNSTTIQTTPSSSSSSSTPVAQSTPDASRYTCPKNLEPNYQTFTYRDHCYQFVTKEEWRSTARDYCRKYQGQLIEIPDQSTMDFVIDVLNKKLKWGVNGVWNGATDQREEGVWKWDGSGNPVTYSNWAQGQPGGLARWTEDCACMRRTDSWQWHDYGCSQPGYSYRYICQYGPLPTTSPSSLSSQSSGKGEVTPTTSSPRTMLSQSSRKGEVTSTTSSPRTMSSQSSRKGEVTSISTLPQTTAVDAAKGPLSLKNQDEHGVSSSNNKATYLGIGITCGAVILIVIVVIAVVWHYKRRNKYPRFQDRVQFNNNLYQLDQVSLEASEDQNMNSKTTESVDALYSKPDKLHVNSNSDNTDVTLMPNELYA
ncbi:uncharacterized protein LOC106177921 isoform X2 [Lingula anatina]|uniref:Uncharacterized protein LOC106177921 isoform X2 n=1 Tax=Lingula anatina TaxID=7574 RepID=A0A1S3K1Q6_LINAN|nr:uncharacterized protein LOC106177921 isoform X2 [Lingula anatina]|eukprot:XP_013416329.1 uncharacterized protein LOC106177921 isoform X2 [Lingula anatina]